LVASIVQSSVAWSTSLFDLFLLLSRVVMVIAVGVPEDRLDEREHVSIVVGVESHLTVLKPDQIVARLFGICFTFKVIARARVDEVLNSADVVITYQVAGIWNTNDIVVLVKD